VTLVEPRETCALVWNDERVSYIELLRRVRVWSHHISTAGSQVIVFSENSLDWVYGAYAIWAAQAVLVPVDHTSTVEELTYVINDCEPTLVLCSPHLFDTVQQALAVTRHQSRVLVLGEFENQGTQVNEPVQTGPLVVDEITLATIVYTSGTTGDPKGVMLTFGNLMANVRPVVTEGYFTPEASVLLLLPLHHVLPLAGSLIAPLFAGSTIVFATSLSGEKLTKLLQQHAVTAIVGVPRFYDLLHHALRERINESFLARTLFNLARRVRSRTFSRLVFGSVHRKFGGALEHLICGGAALSPDTAETFDILGFYMCQGYGMTECSPMIAFPRLPKIKLGSCGQVLDGCEARIADGGEIVARGPNVMRGYYNRPEETQAMMPDGWLHTGDLGHFDDDGYLYVSGRLKEILVLASGKKVNPSIIETALLSTTPAVREVGVFLDGDVLHALLVPNLEVVPVTERQVAEVWLRKTVLEPYNATVSPYRRVARLTVVNEELPRTRLGKLRRHLLASVANRVASTSPKSSVAEQTSDSVVSRLLTFFERRGEPSATAASHLSADLGLDSLGRVELSVFVERVFGITLAETQLSEFETVFDLARHISQFKNAENEATGEVSWTEILQPKTPPVLPQSSFYHRVIALVSRLAIRVFFRVTVHGKQALPVGPFILVPNHQSYIDGLFVCAYIPTNAVLRTLFYAKEQHVRKSFVKFLARRCNTIIMNPKEGFLGSLQQLAAGLKQGNNLIIFPEGTRSRNGILGPFKDSYALLASELHVPVVPVVIDGADAVLPSGKRFPNLLKRIHLTYLETMQPTADESVMAFNARVRSRIAETLAKERS
jgi:long-chain acyl-CoA synthetase